MNNEEKILRILIQMQSDIIGLKEGQTKLEQGQVKLEQGQAKLEQGQAKLEQGQAKLEQSQVKLEQNQVKLEQEIKSVKETVLRIENIHGEKIAALFDGYSLRGDQVERLRDHLDERLNVIQSDLAYVVGKIAQHDVNIARLNKLAK